MKYMTSTKELSRLAVIKSAIDGAYTAKRAAKKLGISARWVKSLKKAVGGVRADKISYTGLSCILKGAGIT
jgi:hypothetical protein